MEQRLLDTDVRWDLHDLISTHIMIFTKSSNNWREWIWASIGGAIHDSYVRIVEFTGHLLNDIKHKYSCTQICGPLLNEEVHWNLDDQSPFGEAYYKCDLERSSLSEAIRRASKVKIHNGEKSWRRWSVTTATRKSLVKV